MQRSASRRCLLAVFLGLGFLASCRLFVDLDGITGDPPADGGPGDEPPAVLDDSGKPIPDSGQDGIAPRQDGGANVLDGIVLLLHMDETTWSGVGSVIDSSGSKNNGTPVGPVIAVEGKFGNAAMLDGTTYIRVPDSVSLHAAEHLTAAAWINPTGKLDGNLSPGILCKRDGFGANVAYTMFLWTDEKLWVDIGNDSRTESGPVFALNRWVHVAIVFDGTAPLGSRIATYVNGLDAGVFPFDAGAVPAATSDLLVGNLPQGGDIFQGLIDEAAVWSRSLSPSEILTIATSNKPLE